MNPISIDVSKCIGCGLCVKDCPSKLFKVVDGVAKFGGSGCIECGHCYAICPKEAIGMNFYDTSDCEPIVPMTDYDSDKLLTAMKSRRTIRFFKDQPVEQEKIDKILEAGRYCQTAANGQNVHYTILGSKQDEIEKECVKIFRAGVKAGSPFVNSLKDYNVGDHFFFRGAPLVIVVSGRGSMSRGLSTSYMELMAESMGLGVLISGFTEICLNINPKLRSMLKLPFGDTIYSVMIIGYPDVKYQRTVPRKPLKARYL